jgi:hypothetical protein
MYQQWRQGQEKLQKMLLLKQELTVLKISLCLVFHGVGVFVDEM